MTVKIKRKKNEQEMKCNNGGQELVRNGNRQLMRKGSGRRETRKMVFNAV